MLVCVMLSCLFLVALWSSAGKGLTYWLSCLLCFVTFPNVSSGSHQYEGWGWRHETSLNPPVKYFTDHSKAVSLLWIFYVLGTRWWCPIVRLLLSHWYPGSGGVLDCIDSWSFPSFLLFLSCVCYAFGRICLYVPCGHLLGKGSNCEIVTYPLVSWVRCGTWFYWFLVFAPLLTLSSSKCKYL